MEKSLKNVTIFFVLTIIQTWGFYFTIIFTGLTPFVDLLGTILFLCGGIAPTFIGIIMALVTYNKEDKKEFFKRSYQVKRISIKWWLFILLFSPAVITVTMLITLITGGEMPEMEGLRYIAQNPISLLPILLVGFIINGAFPEEFGWRGFALQPLLDRFGFFKANLLLGIIWSAWHLPLFFMSSPAVGHSNYLNVWYLTFFTLSCIGTSMIMSLVFIKTRQSTLSAILLHFMFNLAGNQIAPYSDTFVHIIFALYFIIGIGISVYIHLSKIDVSPQNKHFHT